MFFWCVGGPQLCFRGFFPQETVPYVAGNSVSLWKEVNSASSQAVILHRNCNKILQAESESEVAAQSCLTLCNPMDCSLPGFSVHGILQARILEWVTISFSRGSSQHRGSNPGLLHWRQTLSPLSHGPKNEPRFKPHSTTKELSDSGPLTQTLWISVSSLVQWGTKMFGKVKWDYQALGP